MKIYTLETGIPTLAPLVESFDSGPLLLNGHRLDLLKDIKVLVDSSTVTSREEGESITTTNSASMVGRAIVGGAVLGPVTAAVGAVTAKKESKTSSVITEVNNLELTVQLIFEDDFILNAVIKSKKIYHFLLGMVTAEPMLEVDYLLGCKLEKQKQLKLADEVQKLADEALVTELRWAEVDKKIKFYDSSNNYTLICIFFSAIGALIGFYFEYMIIGIIIGFLLGHFYEQLKINRNKVARSELFRQLKYAKIT